jgi:hypothetical protein
VLRIRDELSRISVRIAESRIRENYILCKSGYSIFIKGEKPCIGSRAGNHNTVSILHLEQTRLYLFFPSLSSAYNTYCLVLVITCIHKSVAMSAIIIPVHDLRCNCGLCKLLPREPWLVYA